MEAIMDERARNLIAAIQRLVGTADDGIMGPETYKAVLRDLERTAALREQPVAAPKRKVIQLQVIEDGLATSLYVLCDDGTMWRRLASIGEPSAWKQLVGPFHDKA